MQLLAPAPSRHVVLVAGDSGHTVAARLAAAGISSEVVPCPTAEAATGALAAGRRYSAVVAANVPTPRHGDPDLAAAAHRAGVPLLTAGPAATPAELAAELLAVATPVRRAGQPPQLVPGPTPAAGAADHDRRLVVVCGPGGTGTSVVAAALAGALAPSATTRGVLLADLALQADQVFLHGLAEPAVGLFDLVTTARYRPLLATDLRCHTIALPRGWLLAGLRRPYHWTAVSPSAFDTVLLGLLDAFDLVVADVTGEVEGERDCGSLDLEERNHMARRSTATADLVVVVGAPGTNGARRMALLVDDLLDHGVDPARIQPAINRTSRPTVRPPRVCGLPALPVGVADAGAEARLLEPAAVRPLAAAVSVLLGRLPAPTPGPALVPVAPGSLGCRLP